MRRRLRHRREVTPTPTPAKRSPTAEPGDPTLNTSNSFWLDNYPLNDLYQYLARQADYQFFQNPFIDSIKVTGELFKGHDPLDNMRELALQYNLVLFQKGRTLYALTQDQIATLPQQEYRYELKYLHPRPEDIQRMLGHFLTPDHGSATLEPQINTIVVSDNETVIPKIARYLKSIDVPRRQISIQVRVISITTTGDKYTWSGLVVDLGQKRVEPFPPPRKPIWTPRSASGRSGLSPQTTASTCACFGECRNQRYSRPGHGHRGAPCPLCKHPGARRERAPGHHGGQPAVNRQGGHSHPDCHFHNDRDERRSRTFPTMSGIYLDPSDAAKGREIGTTLIVTPSILPDNTIRLPIDGTVATQVGTIAAPTSWRGHGDQ